MWHSVGITDCCLDCWLHDFAIETVLLVFHAGVPGPLVAVIVAAITGAIYTAVYAISHEEEKLDSSLTTAELTVVEGEAENIQNPMHDADA